MLTLFFFFRTFQVKPNLAKSEIAGIGVLKAVQMAVCGIRCIDLNINNTLKILGTYFSYNKKLKDEKKICNILTDIQPVLKMRKLLLEGKIVIFKTIAISKILFKSIITTVPEYIVNEL